MKSKTATCFLWYIDSCSILACVFSQQFRLQSTSDSIPYSRFCGKMKALPSYFNTFLC